VTVPVPVPVLLTPIGTGRWAIVASSILFLLTLPFKYESMNEWHSKPRKSVLLQGSPGSGELLVLAGRLAIGSLTMISFSKVTYGPSAPSTLLAGVVTPTAAKVVISDFPNLRCAAFTYRLPWE
jgi:hypothetical protein